MDEGGIEYHLVMKVHENFINGAWAGAPERAPNINPSNLSDVVVYVDDVRVKPRPATASMVMKGKAFAPHVVVVPTVE